MSKIGINKRSANLVVGVMALMTIISSGCTREGTGSATNSNSNSNVATTANINAAPATATPAASLEPREPSRYSVNTTITIQPTGSSPQANIPPLKFSFARDDALRRVSFKLPEPVGEVVYLEKPPLKYLIFPSRNQFVEIDPSELGFQLGEVMSPAAAIARLKERAQYEQMGTETVNGRTAVKYRFKAAADTHTKVGTAQADSIIFVDQETGLPLRSEIETTSSSGAGARIVTAADSIQLTSEPTLFELPTGMKKVTTAELKQQVQGFVATVRAIAGYLKQQVNTQPPPPVAGQPR